MEKGGESESRIPAEEQGGKASKEGQEGPGLPPNLARLRDVALGVQLELGRVSKRLDEILKLGVGSVLDLAKTADDPVEVFIGGAFFGRGEVVGVDGHFGVRITQIRTPAGGDAGSGAATSFPGVREQRGASDGGELPRAEAEGQAPAQPGGEQVEPAGEEEVSSQDEIDDLFG